MSYKQVGEENGHQNEKDDPENVTNNRKWNGTGDFIDVHYSSWSLLEDVVKFKFSRCHGHSLENGAGWIREWGTGEQDSWLIEGHVEGQAKGNDKQTGQNYHLPECEEDVKKHQDIDTCGSGEERWRK